jgi:predicted dehydrogenase
MNGMSKQVRVGVVGTSWWADFMYYSVLQRHPQAQLTAICGRNQENAQAVAQKYAIPHVFGDYRALIASGLIDALVIATPDDLHHPITLAALEAGLHVLCEKPLALNASDAYQMYQRAQEAGMIHMALFTWRFMPHTQYLLKLIADGYIGRCYDAHFHFYGLYDTNSYSWRMDQQRANGILGDLGAHMIDLARLLVGEIAQISAKISTFRAWQGADGKPITPANDSAMLLLAFANGAQGFIHTSADTVLGERWMEQRIVLHGDAGTLEMHMPYQGPQSGGRIRGARHGESSFQDLPIPAAFWGDVDSSTPFMTHVTELFGRQSIGPRLFIDRILTQQQGAPDFYDGWQAQRVIDAALESDRTGRWVDVQEQ